MKDLSPVLGLLKAQGQRLVYDAIYDSIDEEYADAHLLEAAPSPPILTGAKTKGP